ncbi:hypothetical protein BO71DRAFT_483062, partial [Aspergillus ellipticus CBS 707.79]
LATVASFFCISYVSNNYISNHFHPTTHYLIIYTLLFTKNTEVLRKSKLNARPHPPSRRHPHRPHDPLAIRIRGLSARSRALPPQALRPSALLPPSSQATTTTTTTTTTRTTTTPPIPTLPPPSPLRTQTRIRIPINNPLLRPPNNNPSPRTPIPNPNPPHTPPLPPHNHTAPHPHPPHLPPNLPHHPPDPILLPPHPAPLLRHPDLLVRRGCAAECWCCGRDLYVLCGVGARPRGGFYDDNGV